MTMQRRAPVRPKLPAVCRALIDPAAHQSKGNRATFDEWLRDIARGEDVRLSDTMLRGRYLTFPWWFMRECKYPALAQSRDEPSSKLRRRREDAINAYAPEALEKLAARGLWPLDWLSGASPLRFVRRGSTRELEQPASFAEVFNYASMLPTLIAAFSACAEVLQRARVRCRGQTVAPRGPSPAAGVERASTEPLVVCTGRDGEHTLRVKAPGEVIDASSDGELASGRVAPWRRVLVRVTNKAGELRVFVLEPGPEEAEIVRGQLHVRGRFRIAEKINNAQRAEAEWKRADVA